MIYEVAVGETFEDVGGWSEDGPMRWYPDSQLMDPAGLGVS